MNEEMKRAISHLLSRGFRPQVVLDIGAAKGYWSLVCGSFFTQARFSLIDPLTESEPFLRQVCDADPRFHYLLTAVGSEPGQAAMNIAADCDGSSLCDWQGVDPSQQRRVPVTTVDQLLSAGRIEPPDLVKIDVQGYELRVLQGALQMLQHAEVLIVEVNLYEFAGGYARVHEVIRFLAEQQFYMFDLAGTLRRPYEDDLGQLDIVFVSARSPLMSSNRWV
jgi:FkbM family methyltransferase